MPPITPPRIVLSGALLAAVALAPPSSAQSFPVEKLRDAGPDETRLNFVILAEGYTGDELDKFGADALDVAGALFEKSPYRNYAAFFNVHAVAVASAESGVKHPGTATDVEEPASEVTDPDNYFETTLDFAGIHRLMYPNALARVLEVLAASYPGFDQAILLANEEEFGGAGGFFATTTANTSASEIAIHELGHSFAGLQDEYAYGGVVRTEGPNLTAESDPGAVRWARWVGDRGVGVYEIETVESVAYHRPHQTCLMRQLGQPFCAVCSEETIAAIYRLVSPIEAARPSAADTAFAGEPIDFAADLILPAPNTLQAAWLLDGDTVAVDTAGYRLAAAALPGDGREHVLTLRVTDTTALDRRRAGEGGYVFERSWTVTDASVSAVGELRRFFYRVGPNPSSGPLAVETYVEESAALEARVYDAAGRRVASATFALSPGRNRNRLDLGGAPAGAYVLELVRDGGAWRQTVTVIRE